MAADFEEEPFVQSDVEEIKVTHQWPVEHTVEYIVTILFLLPSIIGIVIAALYDEKSSPCNDPDGTTFTIDLDLFLYIGCGVQIATTLCNCICNIISSNSSRIQCGAGTILFVWIIIGLNMYNLQMTNECKNTPIGLMILSWCIIPLCIIGIAVIALCVPFCKMVREWMKHQV